MLQPLGRERPASALAWSCLLFILAASGQSTATAQPGASTKVLQTANEIRVLTPEQAAQGLPVLLRGVATFWDPGLYSRFVQDATAGIYIQEMTNMPSVVSGQMVEVEGVTGAGEYVSVIVPKSVKVVGEGKMPAKAPVSLEQLVSGQEDSQWVEFSGVVRAVRFEKESGYFQIDFVKGGERFTAYSKKLPTAEAQELVDSTVKVRGVCSTMFNHQRQIFGIRLLVPNVEGLVIEKPARPRPFEMAAYKINSLLQYTPGGTFDDRVKVKGTVVYRQPGSALFIQDESSGLFCQTLQRDAVQPGDQVEILGFPAKGEYTPMLEDAIYRKVAAGDEPKAERVDLNKILTGVHDSRLVQLPARILDRVERGVNQFLLLQSGDLTFQAFLPQQLNASELDSLPNGSDVMVTGVCIVERGNNWQAGAKWRAASFHLLLRSAKDVTVLKSPAALTFPDEFGIAGAFGMVAVAALAWVVVLKKNLRRLNKQ